jgi:hypothetical protein
MRNNGSPFIIALLVVLTRTVAPGESRCGVFG